MELSLSDLPVFAQSFVQKLSNKLGKSAHIVGLKGNLGAGKTTFVQQVAKQLGVKEQVTSPTFVIAQVYETTHPVFKKLVHIDAYRLEDETKDTIGFTEYASDPENIVFVEWPAYLPTPLAQGTSLLEFEVVDENTRRITEHAVT